MVETLHEMAMRFCNECSNCHISGSMPCIVLSLKNNTKADEQIEVLKKWAEEHPPKPKRTFLDVLLERFPDVQMIDGAPNCCPFILFKDVSDGCEELESCVACWNRVAPAKYQEIPDTDNGEKEVISDGKVRD